MTDKKKSKYLVARLADKIMTAPHEAVAYVNAKTAGLITTHTFEVSGGALVDRTEAENKATAKQAKIDAANGQVLPPDQAKALAEARTTTANMFSKYAAYMMLADKETGKVVESINKLDRFEFMRGLTGGQKIFDAGSRLSGLRDEILAGIGGKIFGFKQAALVAPDQAALTALAQQENTIQSAFKEYDRTLNEAIAYANAMLDREAWNAIVKVEGIDEWEVTAVFAVLGGIVSLGSTVAGHSPIRGVAAATATVGLAMTLIQNKVKQLSRDHRRGKMREKYGPNYPYEQLNKKVYLMAERVAGKQAENVNTMLALVSIGGAELPYWEIIRKAIRSIIVAYYDARVTKLKLLLGEDNIVEQLVDFAKDAVKEEFIEVARGEIGAAAGKQITEAIKSGGEEAKKEFVDKAQKVLQEAPKEHLKDVAGKAAEEASKGAGAAMGELAKSIGVGLAEGLVARLLGKAIEQILARFPIERAQAVTGFDIKDAQGLLETSLGKIDQISKQ